MKRKIKCVYIDGMEKSGKTSIIREMRKYFKNKNKDLHEISGTNFEKIKFQKKILEDNSDPIVLKKNSILSIFYNDLKEKRTFPNLINEQYSELLRQEKVINHDYGSVFFFLIPEKLETIKSRSEQYDLNDFSNLSEIYGFYKNINQYNIAQGLDIVLIYFSEDDKIYDIKDLIIKNLEQKYNV